MANQAMLSRMTNDPIQLDRQFAPPEERGAVRLQGHSWDDLRDFNALVVLAEAGAGKSTEMRMRAATLRSRGEAAGVLRLEALQRDAADKAFDSDTDRLALTNRAVDKPLTVFLDALDEARLPRGRGDGPLRDALQRLGEWFGKDAMRAKVVISCRASEWRHEADRSIVEDYLKTVRRSPTKPWEAAAPPMVHVVQLLPLDDSRIALLAKHSAVNVEAFLGSLRAARLIELARHPLETSFLVDLWKRSMRASGSGEQAFTSRTDVFARLVEMRLRESNAEGERRSDLSPSRAIAAAEKLAAAVVLTGLPAISAEEADDSTLSAVQVLDAPREAWTAIEARQLLVTGLFQPAYKGHIRFAHREVQDFLAARYFDRAIRANAGLTDSIDPLFSDDRRTVPPSTSHCLAWLAGMNEQARKRVIASAPALLIEEGDPAQLNPLVRREALEALIRDYNDRQWRGLWFSDEDLSRFATPELAQTVAALLTEAASEEALGILCDIVRVGQFRALVLAIQNIAEDETKGYRLRADAAQTIAALGTSDQRRRLFEAALVSKPTNDPDRAVTRNRFLSYALLASFPNQSTNEEAALLLSEVERERRNMSSGLSDNLAIALRQCPADRRLDVITRLSNLAGGARYSDLEKLPALQERYTSLISPIAVLAADYLTAADGPPNDQLLDAIELARFGGGDHRLSRYRDELQELREILRRDTNLKLALFWRRTTLSDKGPRDKAWVALHPMDDDDDSIFDMDDVRVLARQVQDSATAEHAEIAAEAGEIIASKIHEWEAAYRILLRHYRASPSPRLRKEARQQQFRRLTAPLQRMRYKAIHYYKLGKWKRFFGKVRVRSTNFLFFLRHLSEISAGKDKRSLRWAAKLELNDVGAKNIELVRKDYGGFVASAFAVGFKRYWLTLDADPANVVQIDQIAALVGIALTVEATAEVAQTEDEAARAIRLAFAAIRMPEWLEAVARKFPTVYTAILEADLQSDLSMSAQRAIPADSVRNVAYAPEYLQRLAAPLVLSTLEQATEVDDITLEPAVALAAGCPTTDVEKVTKYLSRHFDDAVSKALFDRAWILLHAWLLVDAEKATDALASLADRMGPDNAHFVGLIAQFSERLGGVAARDDWRADLWSSERALSLLIEIAYRCAPPETDIAHEDGYSPNQRDNAESARRALTQTLVRRPTPEAKAQLLRLSQLGVLSRHREVFLHYVDEHQRATLLHKPLTQIDALAVLRQSSRRPASAKEFCDIVGRQVRGLLIRLREGEDDEGRRFRSGDAGEDDLRDWLSGRLRDLGAGVYDVVRDPKVSDDNRPDIRLACLSADNWILAIEVKLAEKWTGPKHMERLRTQLVDQYMGEVAAPVGLYVLAHCTEPRRVWEIDQRTCDLSELQQELARVAETIVTDEGLIAIGVVAVGIHRT